MNSRNTQNEESGLRARAFRQARAQAALAKMSGRPLSRRQFFRTTGAVLLGAALGSELWRPGSVAAHGTHDPVPIPGGTPILGGAFHVFGPGVIDPDDAEPSSITDFNGFVGIAFISGTVTRTNTATGEVRTLPFIESDLRFMQGVFRGQDGNMHQGAFGFI